MNWAILMSPNRTKHCVYGYIYIVFVLLWLIVWNKHCMFWSFIFCSNIKNSPHCFLSGIWNEDGLNNQYYSIIDPCNLWNKTWEKQNLYFVNWRVYIAGFRGKQNYIIRHNAPVRMNTNYRIFLTPLNCTISASWKKIRF